MSRTWTLVPEDDAVHNLLTDSESLLSGLTHANDPDDNPTALADPWRLPDLIVSGAALAALDRVARELRAVLPGADDTGQGQVRLLAPGGVHEHVPVHVVRLDPADLATLAAVLDLGRQALDPAARTVEVGAGVLADLAELLDQIDTGTTGRDGDTTPAGPDAALTPLARLLTLLTLSDDGDHQVLLAAHRPPRAEVVLTAEQDQAYTRLARRWVDTLSGGDPLQRWLYLSR
uniref:hypothetical protein n=1 Tax=Actinokineospora sp. CA-119265 TaxID=3239890 RepID=UPI003F497262